MVARVFYSDNDFVGAGIDLLPKLPIRLPVAGYVRRWFAQHFDQFSDGVSIASWPDTVDHMLLKNTNSGVADATQPRLATVSGERVVRFNGSTDAIGNVYTPLVKEPFTVSMVIYVPVSPMASGFLYATTDDALKGLITTATGTPSIFANGRAASPVVLSVGWHIITAVGDGASTKIRVDDSTASTYADVSTTWERKFITLGRSPWGGGAARYDVAEVVEYDDALSDAEIGQLHAAFKTRYPV